jgi:vWA-MoxR associated protein C-terminal domain
MMADPKRTSVLAVGLERYGFGSERSLPGVALYAVRFAKWAIARGVPPSRVRLACSWVQKPAPKTLRKCIHVQTTAEVLIETLLDLMVEGGDLLLLYWCGHGVAAQGARTLFTSNADDVLLANLPVDKIRSLLASSHGAGFPQQVLIFDACANHFEQLGYKGGLPPAQIPDLPPRGGTQQFFYFATDVGRVAGYDRTTQQAAFSTEVVRWLESQPTLMLPPDLAALRGNVEATLEAEDAAGVGPPVPVTLVVQDFSGGETDKIYGAARISLHGSQLRLLGDVIAGGLQQISAGFGQAVAAKLAGAHPIGPGGVADVDAGRVAAGADGPFLGNVIAAAFKAGQADAIIAILGSVAAETESPDDLFVREVQLCWERQQRIAPLVRPLQAITLPQMREAHALAVPPGARLVVHNLVEALDDAAQHTQPPVGPAPLEILVTLLEQQTGVRIDDTWFDLDPQELATLRAGAAPRLAAGGARARLVIDLRSAAPDTGVVSWPPVAAFQLLHAGQWSERQEIRCGPTDKEATAAVEAAVRWAGSQVGSFSVGLVMSRPLFDRVPEAWLLREEDDDPQRPLGFLHPVVLHSAERLASGRRRTSWADRLAAIRARPATLDVDWMAAAQAHDPDAILVAVEASQATCIGLEFPPGPAAQPLGNDPLMVTVKGGAPYVVWFETEPTAWPQARGEAEWVVAGGGLSSVAERLFTVRRAAPGTISGGLRALWDDDAELPNVARLQGGHTLAAAAPVTSAPALGGP